jgi:pilus assembly protein Flp/PilA
MAPLTADRDDRSRSPIRFTGVRYVMSRFWTQRGQSEAGQGLAEYALILALIAVVAIAALVFLGTTISSILSTIGANI